jgi:murein DD-endopeptidase MepM/ murein hydrolase activator NlpD
MAFDIGERVHATTGLNVRRKPGLDHTVLDAVPAGTSGDITDGVITTGGYTWWQIDWGDLTGWSVQKYLESESGFRPSSADAQSEHGDVTWPISGQITSDWYDLRDYGYHRSIDVAAARGTEIGAARAGTVSNVLTLPDGGRSVFVDHESGYQTRYMHLSEWACEDGQRVDRGETIGYVGSTGHSTGPHLHFEIERWGSNQYVPGEGGDNVTKGDPIPQEYADL